LAIQQALEKCCFGRAKLIAVIDDITIVGPLRDALRTFARLKKALRELNLEMSASKCAAMHFGAVVPEGFKEACAEHGLQISDQLMILGVCVTDSDIRRKEWLFSQLDALKSDLKLLQHENMQTQTAMLLLRQSFNARFDYLTRVVPFSHAEMAEALRRFDGQILRALAGLLQVDALGERQKQLARQPISMGGLGLVGKLRIAPIANYASMLQAVPDVVRFYKGDVAAMQKSWLHRKIHDAETALFDSGGNYRLQRPDGIRPIIGVAADIALWAAAAEKWHNLRLSQSSAFVPDSASSVAPNTF
jgi:hypothetical protein